MSQTADARVWRVRDAQGQPIGWDVETIGAEPDPTTLRIAELEAEIEALTLAVLA